MRAFIEYNHDSLNIRLRYSVWSETMMFEIFDVTKQRMSRRISSTMIRSHIQWCSIVSRWSAIRIDSSLNSISIKECSTRFNNLTSSNEITFISKSWFVCVYFFSSRIVKSFDLIMKHARRKALFKSIIVLRKRVWRSIFVIVMLDTLLTVSWVNCVDCADWLSCCIQTSWNCCCVIDADWYSADWNIWDIWSTNIDCEKVCEYCKDMTELNCDIDWFADVISSCFLARFLKILMHNRLISRHTAKNHIKRFLHVIFILFCNICLIEIEESYFSSASLNISTRDWDSILLSILLCSFFLSRFSVAWNW